jgi:integral membrane protein (TIGR01906 family)
MVLLGAGLVFTFSTVFVGFHRLFFEGDTWLFYYSDTLIRLFPERFWRDVFLLLAGATLAEAVALHLLATRLLRADLARPGRGAPRPEAGNTP